MKIAYFSSQMPYPPTHGGRVDDWRRLLAMKAAGAELLLVTWCSDRPGERPSDEEIKSLSSVADIVHIWPIRRTWAERLLRLARLPFWPSHVASRIPGRKQWVDLRDSLDQFHPDVIWQDGVYAHVVAKRAKQHCVAPLFYRSHNIEYQYFRQQVAKARRWKDKLAWGLNLPHLERVERNSIREAALYFDISNDDLSFWLSQGYTKGRWLPPLIDPDFSKRLAMPLNGAPGYDVGYLGNLYAPNNVAGVLWFLKTVVPILLAKRPGLKIFVAGSRPVDEVRGAIEMLSCVTLIENAPDAVDILRSARVLVNPIFSGSGVNVKSVEMLFSHAVLVSAPQGVAGLPDSVRSCFHVTSEAQGFSDEILRGLSSETNEAISEARVRARNEFSSQRIGIVLNEMQDVVDRIRGHVLA